MSIDIPGIVKRLSDIGKQRDTQKALSELGKVEAAIGMVRRVVVSRSRGPSLHDARRLLAKLEKEGE